MKSLNQHSALVLLVALAAWLAAPRAAERAVQETRPSAQRSPVTPALELQVRLDRAGFSPGEIDGVSGPNTERAAAALAKAGKALGPQSEPAEIVVPYAISTEDVAGPFTESIPGDLMEQAKMPALNYTSAAEALAERFHAAPALLKRLNPSARFGAGETIVVPNVVTRLKDAPVQTPAPQTPNVRVVVSKNASALTVYDEKGAVIFHAPVTSGSERDPLPLGKWAVTTVSRRPTFHYTPDLFWDADPTHAKAKIPPGPNNPVGLVWIDLTREHYGIHGTPEPGKVGHTQSHGCVRLTNWDALYLAKLVKKGTTVAFER